MIWIKSDTQSQVLLFMCASVQNYERAIQAEQIPSDSDRGERKICHPVWTISQTELPWCNIGVYS